MEENKQDEISPKDLENVAGGVNARQVASDPRARDRADKARDGELGDADLRRASGGASGRDVASDPRARDRADKARNEDVGGERR